MKHIKIGVIALLIFGIAFAFTSIISADTGVNATPETQSLGTTTNADVVGLVMETDAGTWTLTNNPSGGIHTGVLDPGQVQYTTAYDANIVAQGGHTSFVKQMNLHTGNKVISQSNLLAKTGLAFAGTTGGGNVVGSENLLLDGAGNTTSAYDRVLCPFASAGGNYIPAYCNIIQMGSSYDLTAGSVTTQADNRFVGTDATTPVVQNYQINIKPFDTTSGNIPATGSASAYIKTNIQEARNNGTPLKSEDLQYLETSSASGTITKFSKSMGYTSQFTGSPKDSVVPTIFHTITATAGQWSWITPVGSVQVPDHGSQTFQMGDSYYPGSGVDIYTDLGNTFGTSYTFSDVTSDHTIHVSPRSPSP